MDDRCMTDRELLEAAAKAAGCEGEWLPVYEAIAFCDAEGMDEVYWNPLNDDGDALRLSTQLGIDIVRHHSRGTVAATRDSGHYIGVEEPIGDDAHAATRRAIVRAAAEIGKEKA